MTYRQKAWIEHREKPTLISEHFIKYRKGEYPDSRSESTKGISWGMEVDVETYDTSKIFAGLVMGLV